MPPIEEGAPRQEPAASQPSEPNGDEDWKAKYEALLGHSRDWEKKAKANKEAAEKLAELEKANRSVQGSSLRWRPRKACRPS